MNPQALITILCIIAFFCGIYLLLSCKKGPNPVRRFVIGVICMLGGGLIPLYQVMHL